jgi:hypothetical protein
MTPTVIICGRHARLAVLAAALAAGSGCFSEPHASLIHARVSDGVVKAGLNPGLQIGMPLHEATAYLESCGFRPECREHPPSAFPAGGETTLHYVRVLPHPFPLDVTHPEVHVLLLHDGNRVTDIKSEKVTTTVD